MSGNQDRIAPIMSKGDHVYSFGSNAYGKPATALNILRETIMGKELFDYAFKTYAQRWMFKHPSPEDFFRTMEDASAVDLDWFWRGWFYSTDVVDIGLKSVKRYHISPNATEEVKEIVKNYGMTVEDLPPMVFMVSEDSEEFSEELKSNEINSEVLRNYLDENSADFEGKTLPKFFYEIEFEKPGGIVMPIIVEYEYADGTKEQVTYPVQVWRKNPDSVKKAVTSDKEIIRITIDPNAETADVDLSNNAWPKEEVKSDFDKFKETVKG